MRDGHPDDDQLADLAADVLPLAEARAVEAHVMACERCSRMLADAERIRGLLVSADPGPMPADVWARIESALTSAGSAAAPGAAAQSPSVPVHAEHVPAAAAWDDDADPFDARSATPHRGGSGHGSSRAARGTVPSRRETRPSGRRPARGIAAVVGLAAAAVVGVVTVNALRGESSTSGGTAAIGAQGDASSAASAPAAGAGGAARGTPVPAVRYERSGTAYTSAGLARQAQALTKATSAAAPAASPPVVTPPVPAASPGRVGGAERMVQAAPDPTATDISNPANLDGCLAALKTSRDRLVAVDLATYQDREAAVLLLHATGGGYEVFVVERTCSAGDDHTLAYAPLKG